MAADDIHPVTAGAPPDRNAAGWLLRTLKPGDSVELTGGIRIELLFDKRRPRLAIRAPRDVRATFSRTTP